MSEALISVLTPAYNTGAYIHRLLKSVLSQTYPLVEMIVVDDGSTDNTASVIKSFIPRFEKRGYTLRYVYQENSGQSVAIQNGLQYVRGEYMVWPDSDDYYAVDTALERMVSVLASSGPEVGLVRSGLNVVEDVTFRLIKKCGPASLSVRPFSLFEDCLFAKNGFYFTPGVFMVKFPVLQEVIGSFIYTDKDAGQNWQILLPILYNYRCVDIPEQLHNQVVRIASHSRGQYKGYDRLIQKFSSYERTVIHTLQAIKAMPDGVREKYNREIRFKYMHQRLILAFRYNQKADFLCVFDALRDACELRQTERILRVLFDIPGGEMLVRIARRIKRAI